MELGNLNPMQREAVLATEGPVLVLAGAGSGKTTVLVNRIAYMIEEKDISPFNILAITFTNKAAKEMYERIERLLGEKADDMWISTFHSACVKILRSTIHLLGYERDFVIYDSADSGTLIKECIKDLDLDDKMFPPRMIASIISKAKDNMQSAEDYLLVNEGNYFNKRVAEIYARYQKKLKINNALDFDDIILNTVKILSENPDVLERYQRRFRYIMVDEYQDTNNVQYMLISLLAQGTRNICVVGDDDQSIYKFRGANIQNILGFEDEFADAKVIKLEQNYRSTQNILDTANGVIGNNRGRKAKALWTENDRGEKVKLFRADNEYNEGGFIAQKIDEAVRDGANYSDVAILYRTNSQSRVIEEMLMRNAIPYRVLAGLRFYDRKEIKDIIAYLRVIHNGADSVSLKRIINEPKRGIGNATMDKATDIADAEGTSVWEVVKNAHIYPELSRAAMKLVEFSRLISDMKKASDTDDLVAFVERVMRDSGYVPMLEAEDTVEAKTRLENLQEFITVVAEYAKENVDPTLGGLLEEISLIADVDAYDEDQDAAVMMTIHSAKGLEFPIVFLTGMEEGLFPSGRCESDEDVEEERRLCYVAITRAKQQLYITNTEHRTIYGRTTVNVPSRFLREVPEEYTESLNEKKAARPEFSRERREDGTKNFWAQLYQSPEKKVDTGASVDFKVGDVVQHRKFGRGIVLSAQSFGKDMRLEIAFDSVGTKQLMAIFAKLEKVDN